MIQAFIQLESTDPFSVAKAFISAILDFDNSSTDIDFINNTTTDALENETLGKDTENDEDSSRAMEDPVDKMQLLYKKSSTNILAQENLIHIVQFCHLCSKGKIPPVLYSLLSNDEITSWFHSLPVFTITQKPKIHLPKSTTDDSESETSISSPDRKISRKDNYLINTMLKIHDAMDKNAKNKEEKDPGFMRLELHCKKLILNASALPPFDSEASSPTEFYQSFLAKKSQFKAKDMLVHRFQIDKIAFNPNPTFITNLWNCEFFWLLPDSMSGVSIFYCQETKASNAFELEKE